MAKTTNPGKQRKMRAKAPLHKKGEFLNAHLSAELRKKLGHRSLRLRVGDKVRIMRGSAKGKTAKVEKLDIRKTEVFLAGFQNIRKDGTKAPKSFEPSNLLLVEASLDDKKRKKRMSEKP